MRQISAQTAGVIVKQINLPQGEDNGKHLHVKNYTLFFNPHQTKYPSSIGMSTNVVKLTNYYISKILNSVFSYYSLSTIGIAKFSVHN